MNRFWEIVMRPCLEEIGAKNIVEIGSDWGKGTSKIIEYCKERKGTCTSIDPFPKYDYKALEVENEGIFKLYEDLSLNRLPLLKDYDAILIDGDHNWYTVYNELLIIKKVFGEEKLPLIFVHDVSWPYARRDLYYNPDTIPVGYRQAYEKKGMLPNELSLQETGGLNDHLYNAIYENNPKNGVLTAVEDFMHELNGSGEIKYCDLGGFHGLGILYSHKRHDNIEKVIKSNTTVKQIISLLEQTRIELFIECKEANKQVKTLSKEIENKNKIIQNQSQQLERNGVELNQLKKKIDLNEIQLNKINSEFNKINNELKSKNRDYDKLFSELNNLSKKYDELLGKNKQLEAQLSVKDEKIKNLRIETKVHLNSIRYRLGDIIIRGAKPSLDTIKMPVRIFRLLKEGINKKKTKSLQTNLNEHGEGKSNKNVVSSSYAVNHTNNINSSEKKEEMLDKLIMSADHSIRQFNFTSFEKEFKKLKYEKVNIIVPIYNAPDEVEKCIGSIIENTTFPYRLILINDCSTDERIKDILSRYVDNDKIVIIENEVNLGYVKTINKAIRATNEGDILLLNSDTVVTKGWLTRMVIAALHDSKIGTVTPFSNAAGAFSVPEVGVNKELPEGIKLEEMVDIVKDNTAFIYPEVPTGNGFCMYIKRETIENIGLFDEDNFPRGYGEENDFCMRAIKSNWKNIIDDSSYIYHKRSASFSDEKDLLIKQNRARLDELYPEYKDKIKVFTQSEELIGIRKKIADTIEQRSKKEIKDNIKKNILYVIHEGGGGTPNTNKDLMSIVSQNDYNTYLLIGTTKQFRLERYIDGNIFEIAVWNLENIWDIDRYSIDEYRNIYFDILYNYKIDIVHIRHLLKHSFDIVDIAHSLNIPIALSFHDFYYICPSIHLLDSKGRYCEGKCNENKTDCFIPIPAVKVKGALSNWVINIWRDRVDRMFDKCSVFITTSNYSKDLHVKIYPKLKDKVFKVIEHGRDFSNEKLDAASFYDAEKIKILLPGNIGFNKGSKFISQLIDLDKENKMEFHLIGKADKYLNDKILSNRIINHGTYEREDFYDKVVEIRPNFVGIFSIWPETYCHTLTEGWSCGIPAIITEIGTLKERGTSGGILIDYKDPSKAYNQIINAYTRENYERLCNEVKMIQSKSVCEMAQEYLQTYSEIF